MIFAWKIVIVSVASYLIGNINFAVILSHLKHGDIRSSGSGNPGTMNMIRSYGKAVGVLCLLLDAFKASIPAFIAWWWMADADSWAFGQVFCQTDKLGIYVSGLCNVVGHIFPVFMKFRGGKGIACIIGVSLVANPVVTLLAFGIGLVFLIVCKIGALASFIMIFTPNLFAAITYGLFFENTLHIPAVDALIFSFMALALFAHRANIVRLFSGTENRTVLFPEKPKPKYGDGEKGK